MKLFYDVIYLYFRAPWDMGAREELVSLVENGRMAAGVCGLSYDTKG